MIECANLDMLAGKSGKEITRWAIDTAFKYNQCKARYEALINAVKNGSGI